MIVEIPQADSCCGLSLKTGVVIIIILRLIGLVLVLLYGTNIFTLGNPPRGPHHNGNWTTTRECENLYNSYTSDIILLTVTVVLILLWILLMIPAVIWDLLPLILLGAIMEIIIWFWIFFIFAYHLSLALVKEFYLHFLLIYAIIWLVLECVILWVMWSFYVDEKEYDEEARRMALTEED